MTAGRSDEQSVSGGDRGIDVALAEFSALRQEINTSRTVQGALVGVGLTAVGVIFTFALQQPDDGRLLLAVPLLGLVVSLLHLSESFRMHRQGDYIRNKLWPFLQEHTSFPHSWEKDHADRPWTAGTMLAAVVFDGAVPGLFVLSGIAALVYAEADATEMAIGWVAIALMVLAPILLAFALRRRTSWVPSSTSRGTADNL